jgi:hypothetical protein
MRCLPSCGCANRAGNQISFSPKDGRRRACGAATVAFTIAGREDSGQMPSASPQRRGYRLRPSESSANLALGKSSDLRAGPAKTGLLRFKEIKPPPPSRPAKPPRD